jgi:isopenicillin-N epimerase
MKELWTLDPQVTFLNHGSFGACPRAALEHQGELRARLERQPVQFFRDLEGLLDEARFKLAAFVGTDGDDLAFVPNATSGVNTVIRSLRLEPGDELLTTDHAYNSCRNALRWHEGNGVRTVAARVPWPLEGPHQVIDAVLAAVTPRTRLLLIDHVTSPTGVIFPVGELTRLMNERGIDTLIDGAHAPGMLPLDLNRLGAAYYTGNCHKWLCAPKGSAFLHVRRDRQALVQPLAHGHGLNSSRTDRGPFRLQMDWLATADPTAYLTVPFVIEYLERLMPWPQLMQRNHDLALEGRRILCAALGTQPPAPEFMLGSLAAALLPDFRTRGPAQVRGAFWHPLSRTLLEQHGIEVPVIFFPSAPRQHVRISAQLYNSTGDYHQLAAALRERRTS